VRGGGAVERRFERRDHPVVHRILRPILSNRRHLTRAELANDFLPDFRILRDVVRHHRLENEAALLVILVVTRETVLVDKRHVRSGRRLKGVEAEHAARQQRDGNGEREREPPFDSCRWLTAGPWAHAPQ